MRILKIKFDSETGFCTLVHPYSSKFISFISQGIKPFSYRVYSKDTKIWSVHISKIVEVVQAGKRYFDEVDYTSLPNLDREIIDKAINHENYTNTKIKSNPYSILFVAENAPKEVITAAYKALAKKYHPDKGGSNEKFVEIQTAYDKLNLS